jgi:hypothetical protein
MKEGRPERLMTTLREYLSTPIEVPCGRGLIFRQVGERRPGRYVDARCLATTPSWPCARLLDLCWRWLSSSRELLLFAGTAASKVQTARSDGRGINEEPVTAPHRPVSRHWAAGR